MTAQLPETSSVAPITNDSEGSSVSADAVMHYHVSPPVVGVVSDRPKPAQSNRIRLRNS